MPWKKPVNRAIAVALELVGHIANTLILIAGIWLVETLILYLWGSDKLVIGWFPFTYLIEILDVVVVVVFVGLGLYGAVTTYLEHD